MKYLFALLVLCFCVSSAYASEVKIHATLFPAGSFDATTKKVTGYAYKTKSGIAAENVTIDIKSLDTEMDTRNKHMQKRLEAEKYPVAKLIKAVGKNGKGSAIIEIKGIKKKYSGTYTVKESEVEATFKVHLPDLKITDVKYMSVGVDDDVEVHITLPLKDKK